MTERFEYPDDREARNAARVRALEALLIEKGVITHATVDKIMDVFTTEMGPFNGAKLVARAWVDPAFKDLLVNDTMAAVAQFGFPKSGGAEGEHMRAVANTPEVHNLIICTLCSCYPWPVLGLPPYWYKDPSFRARAAREPRKVLKEFGLDIEPSKEIRTWDSSAQIRWFVVPERPKGAEDLSEAQLAALLTPEAMMGVALAKSPKAADLHADAFRALRRRSHDGGSGVPAAKQWGALLRARVGAHGVRHRHRACAGGTLRVGRVPRGTDRGD